MTRKNLIRKRGKRDKCLQSFLLSLKLFYFFYKIFCSVEILFLKEKLGEHKFWGKRVYVKTQNCQTVEFNYKMFY